MIGLPDTLRYARYAGFWEAFLNALELPVQKPEQPLPAALDAGTRLMPDAPPSVQLFVGRVLELAANCDQLLIPDLNPGAEPGDTYGAADPYAVDLAAVLERRLSLPELIKLPARLDAEEAARQAVQLGHAWTRNPQLVRRALDKTESLLRPKRLPEPRWALVNHRTVGIAGDPTLLETPWLWQETRAALGVAGLHPVLASELPRDRTLETGRTRRPDLKLETDLETVGAASLLEAKGQVRGLIVITQARATMQRNLAQEIKKKAHKPAIVVEVGEAALEDTLKAFAAKL